MPHTLPPLPYAPDALEPHIDEASDALAFPDGDVARQQGLGRERLQHLQHP